nr:MarR family transcriptional regulator [Bifidobacterium crudilactis]
MPESARTATGGNVRIIMFLARNQDRDIFQYDIEERCSITPSTASRVLSLMEKKGLIERQAVERDARLRRIVLTPSAFDIVDELKRNANAMETTLFEGFSPSEMTRLSSYFIRMRSNLLATGLVSGSCTNQRNAENGRSTS